MICCYKHLGIYFHDTAVLMHSPDHEITIWHKCAPLSLLTCMLLLWLCIISYFRSYLELDAYMEHVVGTRLLDRYQCFTEMYITNVYIWGLASW